MIRFALFNFILIYRIETSEFSTNKSLIDSSTIWLREDFHSHVRARSRAGLQGTAVRISVQFVHRFLPVVYISCRSAYIANSCIFYLSSQMQTCACIACMLFSCVNFYYDTNLFTRKNPVERISLTPHLVLREKWFSFSLVHNSSLLFSLLSVEFLCLYCSNCLSHSTRLVLLLQGW